MEKVKEHTKQEEIINAENKEIATIIGKDKVKKVFLDILKNNIIFIIGTILLVYKGLLLNHLIGLTINAEVVKYTIFVSMLIMCPTINHKNKFGYIYLNIVYAIVTLIIYADFLCYTYSTNFLSFYQIENLRYSKEIASGVLCIINVKSFLIFWSIFNGIRS